MAILIRCPRCKSETDASASRPGSIIKCVHCRGDMRVPEGAKTPAAAGGARAGGGRQSTLFRRMTNATVPGQRGRSVAATGGSGGERGSSGRGKDMSGLYLGAGIAGLVAVVIAIGIVMKGKGSTEPEPKRGAKKEMRAPIQAPPPPPPPAPPPEPEKPPDQKKKGPPASWEPDAQNYVIASVKPLPTDATAEKDALNFIRTNNTGRINTSPFRYLPFVINSLISEDRDLARASFQALYAFCDDRKLKTSDGKNPIDLAWVNDAEYRGYIYQWMGKWWHDSANKLPDAPGNKEAVERQDWVGLARAMIGGSFHVEDSPAAIAFQKVKNFGRAAWPKLAELIDHEEVPLGRAAAQALQELTGEKKPLPNEQNRVEVKNAWMAWIEKNK